MKLNLKLVAAAMVISIGLQAQNPPKRGCGTVVPTAEWDAWFNQKVEEHKQNLLSGRAQSTNYTIPVIVHVIHGGQVVGNFPNVTQAQINSQITVMNNDYAGNGFNVGNLAATAFSAVGAANCNIRFCLAQLDMNGDTLAEPGIDRVNYSTMGWSNPASFTSQTGFQNYIDGTIKPGTIWNPTYYFNIWITDVNQNVGLLGYATFPAGSGLTGLPSAGTANTDGIWVWTKSFGNTGILQSPYNKGRTASHEAGHWLGLRHIGGDGNGNLSGDCSATDYCNDTPPQKGGYSGGQYGQNFGAPTYPLHATGTSSCSAASPYGDMFMNIMDYTDDAYCYMFTPDQSTRMTTAMTNGFYRKFLTASSATLCGAPASMPTANFAVPANGCADSTLVTTNQSTGLPAPSYSWSAYPPFPGIQFNPNSSAATPNISFITPATYTITMLATNAAGTTSATSVVVISDCAASTVGLPTTAALSRYITLAPNPSSGIVNINTALQGSQNLEVSVHNYLGQFVTGASYKDVGINTYSLDLSSYSNGVYFVTISNGQEKIVKRLILNK